MNLVHKEKDEEKRENLLKGAEDILESEMEILGATAIQDKLAENVKATIEKLVLARVKVWIVTGDKLETTRNICTACNVLHQEEQVNMYIKSEDALGIQEDMDQCKFDINMKENYGFNYSLLF